jgi:hypothetical protein
MMVAIWSAEHSFGGITWEKSTVLPKQLCLSFWPDKVIWDLRCWGSKLKQSNISACFFSLSHSWTQKHVTWHPGLLQSAYCLYRVHSIWMACWQSWNEKHHIPDIHSNITSLTYIQVISYNNHASQLLTTTAQQLVQLYECFVLFQLLKGSDLMAQKRGKR